MRCPSCNARFVSPDVYTGNDGEATIFRGEEVVYNRETTVNGVDAKGEITYDTDDFNVFMGGTVKSYLYMCGECDMELEDDLVEKAAREWRI